MPSYNQIVLTGHITRDPDLRYSNNGTAVCNFTVAVNRSYGDETDFFKVAAWNRGKYELGDWTARDLEKGKLVTVIGECRINEYDGNKYPEVNADKVIYEGRKEAKSDTDDDLDEDDFDLPF